MYRLIFTFIDLIAASALIIPLFSVCFGAALHRGAARTAAYAVSALYFAGVFQLTGMPSVISITPDANIELIPLLPMLSDVKNSILNIALFMPLGFILPALWEKFSKFRYTAFAGFSLSLFIEVMQLFTYRATDVNDLLANTFGAGVGFLIFCLAKKIGIIKISETEARRKLKDFWILTSFSVLIMFFIQPFVSNLLWKFAFDGISF